MSVQAVSTLLPFTPGGAGAQQALLVATLSGAAGATRSDVLAYSVGQQIAIAAWAALLGFIALAFVFRTTDWRWLIRSAEADTGKATRPRRPGGRTTAKVISPGRRPRRASATAAPRRPGTRSGRGRGGSRAAPGPGRR